MSTYSDQELAPGQLLEDLKKYLERFQSQPGRLSNLKQLLGTRPSIEAIQPLTPHDDVDTRLELAEQLQLFQRVYNPSWQFTATQFAAFLLIPISEVQSCLAQGGHKGLVRSLDTIVFTTRWFLKPDLMQSHKLTPDNNSHINSIRNDSVDHYSNDPDDSDDSDDSDNWRTAPTPKHSIESLESDHPKRHRTASRYSGPQFQGSFQIDDNAYFSNSLEKSKSQWEKYHPENGSFCLLTRARSPRIVHILPSSWTQTPYNANTAARVIPGVARMLGVHWTFWSFKLGGVDILENMVPLCPPAHRKWRKAYFGLQRITDILDIDVAAVRDDDPIQIELQFVWLPRRSLTANARYDVRQRDICLDLVDLDSERELYDMRSAPSPFSRHDTNSVLVSATKVITEIPTRQRMFHVETTTQIFPGQVIKAEIPATKVARFCEMIDLAWALTCVASISGAAAVAENGWGQW